MIQTPKEILEQMIKNHGYKGIKIEGGNEHYKIWTIIDEISIPEVIYNYIMKNYNVVLGSSNYLVFHEYPHISQEMFKLQNQTITI